MRQLVEFLVLPPTSLYLAAAVGLLLRCRRPRLGRTLFWGSVLTWVALSVPYVSYALLASLQTHPAIPPDATEIEADAIVVLCADARADPPEYGPDQPGPLTLERARYGAHLARRTGLPLAIAGGVFRPGRRAVSEITADFVEGELGQPVRWRELRSADTHGNALHTAELLRAEGIARVAVVTHAWHVPRALRSFRAVGLEPLAAPTMRRSPPETLAHGLIPRARSLRDASWAIHEWVGRVYYALRH